MGIKATHIYLLFFFVFGWLSGFSQEKSDHTIEANGVKYIIHTVAPKQTLYALSKMYSVSVEDIQLANPEIQNLGIRIGQTIRIPVKKIDKKEAKKSDVSFKSDTIFHEVLKKETMYALTKQYAVSQEFIEKYNPQVAAGLQVGMVIKIPMNTGAIEVKASELANPVTDSLMLHEVKPKETLYSLSKMYGVSIDSIQMVNNGLPDGLKVGASIRIPIANKKFVSAVKRVDSSAVDTVAFVPLVKGIDTLHIAVMLPFCMDKHTTEENEITHEHPYQLTTISMAFMRGFNFALDSLSAEGHHIVVYYFDTKNDTAQVKKLLADVHVSNANLIVGPLFQNNFKLAAKKAKEWNIPIVSPVKISSSLLLKNQSIVKAHASSPSQVIHAAKYMGKLYADSNMVIVSGGDAKDIRYASIFQKYVNLTTQDSVAVNKIWTPSKTNYSGLIKKGTTNTVAIMSSHEAYVSSTLAVLYSFLDETTKINVIGMDSWQNFGSVDVDYLNAMNVTYPVHQQVNYTQNQVVSFIKKFRETYYTDPSLHAFSGFDIGYYFGSLFFIPNTHWNQQLEIRKYNGLSLRFDFVKIDAESGFENQGGYILRYQNFELKQVD